MVSGAKAKIKIRGKRNQEPRAKIKKLNQKSQNLESKSGVKTQDQDQLQRRRTGVSAPHTDYSLAACAIEKQPLAKYSARACPV
jgi:hypothetical protein